MIVYSPSKVCEVALVCYIFHSPAFIIACEIWICIMQNTFSTNFWCVFMPLPDLQVYFVNRVLNPQHAQISKAISIAQFSLSDFPHESLRSCLLEFSYLFLFARYDAVPVFPLNTGSVNSDTCRNSMCAFGPFENVFKKRTPPRSLCDFYRCSPSICSLIMSWLLSVHGG